MLVVLIPAREGSGGNKLGLPTTVTDNGYEGMSIATSMLLEKTFTPGFVTMQALEYIRLLACGTGERKWLKAGQGRLLK